jgi:hypothetical protein
MIQSLFKKKFGSSPSLLWLVSLGVGAPAVLIVLALEPDLVLAALSLLLFGGAAIAAALACAARVQRRTPGLNLWDVAGGLVLTGCAASVFGEPENVALLFEHLFERRAATQ